MRSEWAISIRRACAVIQLHPKSYRYKSRRSGQAALEQRIKEICQTRVRFGYRRVHVLLRREGWAVNAKRIYRLYREMGMQLRNKTPKRRVKAKLREDRAEAVGPNDVPRQSPDCRPFGNRIIRRLADDGSWTLYMISSQPAAR